MEYLRKIYRKVRDKVNATQRKKLVENCAIMLVVGVILIIAAGPFLGGNKDKNIEEVRKTQEQGETGIQTVSAYDFLERKMEALLSNIRGAGKVDVMITYYSGTEKVPAFDVKKKNSETDETDSEGGKRNITQSEYESVTIFEDSHSAGGRQPVILKEVYPEVKGIVIVAEGAGNAAVKEQLARAAAVLMDVPLYKIQVLERKK